MFTKVFENFKITINSPSDEKCHTELKPKQANLLTIDKNSNESNIA